MSYTIADGETRVPIPLAPYEAVFVIFRKPALAASVSVPDAAETVLATIEGDWNVHFGGVAAPRDRSLPTLASWMESSDPALRYFSGTGTYARTIDVPAGWLRGGGRLWLDLGRVRDVAEVLLNGTSAGVAWKPRYRVDVTGALRPGRNRLEIRVANVWRNRLVGDRQPGATPVTFTNAAAGGGYAAIGGVIDKDTPLLPSGLLGPVTIVRKTED